MEEEEIKRLNEGRNRKISASACRTARTGPDGPGDAHTRGIHRPNASWHSPPLRFICRLYFFGSRAAGIVKGMTAVAADLGFWLDVFCTVRALLGFATAREPFVVLLDEERMDERDEEEQPAIRPPEIEVPSLPVGDGCRDGTKSDADQEGQEQENASILARKAEDEAEERHDAELQDDVDDVHIDYSLNVVELFHRK